MLFHTWPFAVFCLVVLPVFFALRRTSLWIPWLGLASYFFYGWWNPYYLILVIYSTMLDYTLVALMDHCPAPDGARGATRPTSPFQFNDRALLGAFVVSTLLTALCVILALFGPATLRPTMTLFILICFLMALGAFLRSRKTWLIVSIVNNLALLIFFKYAGFGTENVNLLLEKFHWIYRLPDPSTLMPLNFPYLLPVG